MRNTVLLICLTTLGMLVLVIINTIYGRMDRRMELESNLSSVVETTLEDMVFASFYDYQDMDVFMETFTERILTSIDTSNDITVDVFQFDMEKGVLSIRVTLSYMHPNSEKGEVMCERHVILNRLTETEQGGKDVRNEK